MAPSASAAPAGTAGMRVILDPETGERIARPARGAASPAARPFRPRRSTALRSETLANGTVLLHLDESYMEYAVVRIDAQGKRHLDCVSGPAAARRLRAPRSAAVTSWTEE
jgi:hypothetical protein